MKTRYPGISISRLIMSSLFFIFFFSSVRAQIQADSTVRSYVPSERNGYIYKASNFERGSDPYWFVQEGVCANDLVSTIVGSGIEWSSALLAPSGNASGIFWGPTSLGFNDGIVLTTGCAGDGGSPGTMGANSRPNLCGVSVYNGGPTQDPDLQNIALGSLNDICRLSFDFIPHYENIVIKYVFASEEYSQYVNSSFNDVFGIFLTGPNPNNPNQPYEGENLAVLPDTIPPVAVSINNVNNGQINCPLAPIGPCKNCAYFIHIDHDTIQYNGRTVALLARAEVVPYASYHIKIAIADVSDSIWDSGVFLAAGSLRSFGEMNIKYSKEKKVIIE